MPHFYAPATHAATFSVVRPTEIFLAPRKFDLDLLIPARIVRVESVKEGAAAAGIALAFR